MITQVNEPTSVQQIAGGTDAAHRLAYLLKAIEDEEMAFAERRTEHKDTMERLQNLVYKIRQEILTGQGNLLDVMTEISHE